MKDFQIYFDLYTIQQNRMFGREPYFCLFSTCCPPNQSQGSSATPLRQVSESIEKQEAKFSLKCIRKKSSKQSLSINDQPSLLLKNGQQRVYDSNLNTKQHFLSRMHQPTSKNEKEFSKQKMSLSRSVFKRQITKQMNFTNIKPSTKQNKFMEENDLQKTAKIFSPKMKPMSTLNKITEFQLQQTKLLNKKKWISNLITSKKNVISINNIQSEIDHEKVEQSMIMIDYFHPPQEKIQEIHSYLERRTN